MKTTIKLIALALLFFSFSANAQKKVQKVSIIYTIKASADEVWKVIGEDYASIYKSHPKVLTSNFINEFKKAEKGAKRVCYFNNKKTKYVKETITEFDAENYICAINVYEEGGFPLNTEYTHAIQKIIPIDNNSCKFVMEFYYRTKPGFLGGMAKGAFRKGLRDYAMAIEHHILTGENINKENFKLLKKKAKNTSNEL